MRHIVIIAAGIGDAVAREENHADVALADLPLQPCQPIEDRAAFGLLLVEQPHLDLAVEPPLLALQRVRELARVLSCPGKRVDLRVLEFADADDERVERHGGRVRLGGLRRGRLGRALELEADAGGRAFEVARARHERQREVALRQARQRHSCFRV